MVTAVAASELSARGTLRSRRDPAKRGHDTCEPISAGAWGTSWATAERVEPKDLDLEVLILQILAHASLLQHQVCPKLCTQVLRAEL